MPEAAKSASGHSRSAIPQVWIWDPRRIPEAIRRLRRCHAARRELYVPGRALEEAARLARAAGVPMTIWNLSRNECRVIRSGDSRVAAKPRRERRARV